MVDLNFWRSQAERFRELETHKDDDRGTPIRASFNPDGWGGLRTFPAFRRLVADRWRLHRGTPAAIDEFKSLASKCAVALGCDVREDGWEDWLDYLRRESVEFVDSFTLSVEDDPRPEADPDVTDTQLGEIENVCRASWRFCMILADESEKIEIARRREAKGPVIATRSLQQLSANLVALRKRTGLTVDRLAAELGFSRDAVFDHAAGRHRPETEALAAYATVFSKYFGMVITALDLFDPGLMNRFALTVVVLPSNSSRFPKATK